MHLLVADFGSAKILPDDYNYEELQQEIEQGRQDESDDEAPTTRRKRKVSFVGTAQYVSPEVLNGNAAHPAIDLFSYGSIIYQMLCGTFAFNAPNEYLIFQKINKLNYEIPEGEFWEFLWRALKLHLQKFHSELLSLKKIFKALFLRKSYEAFRMNFKALI